MTEVEDEYGLRDEPVSEKTSNLNKACEACRGSKLRCIVEDGSTGGICKRCLATGRTCVFNAPRQRQRRKRLVDIRVAELERQLRSLRMQLHHAQNFPSGSHVAPAMLRGNTLKFEAPVTPASWPRKSAAVSNDLDSNDPSFIYVGPLSQNAFDGADNANDDVLDRKVVEWHEADRLVKVYLAEFAPSYPFVTLPFFSTTEAFRQERPATFLAVLATASVTSSSSSLNRALYHELLALLARRVMLEGEHNLDLIQAMIMMTIWYSPMDKFDSLRHYQFAHLAATIAMDMGMGDRKIQTETSSTDNKGLEMQRSLLSIYLLCTGVAITTGRSRMLRFTDAMQDAIDCFKGQPYVSVQDRWFVAWIELQRVTETAASSFFVSPTDISVPSNQTAVADICQSLDTWRSNLGFELGGALEIHYYYVRSIVLSVCLYVDHDMADFRPPFRVKSRYATMPLPTPLSPFYARTALALVQNVHAALDSFLRFDTKALLAAPVIYYIRTLHPLSILLMLDMACHRSGNELGKILDQDTLKVNDYFQSLKKELAPYKDDSRKTPAKFLGIISRMETWWQAQSQETATNSHDLYPFAQLASTSTVSASSVPSGSKNISCAQWKSSFCRGSPGYTIDPNLVGGKVREEVSPGNEGSTATTGSDALSQENWVTDFEHDAAIFLLPDIDWALFEEHDLMNPI